MEVKDLAVHEEERVPVPVGAHHQSHPVLIPKAMAVVEPLMFRSLNGLLAFRGLTVKLRKFPLLSMVNPTAVPEFAMPFMLVPAPGFVPAFGPSKLTNV